MISVVVVFSPPNKGSLDNGSTKGKKTWSLFLKNIPQASLYQTLTLNRLAWRWCFLDWQEKVNCWHLQERVEFGRPVTWNVTEEACARVDSVLSVPCYMTGRKIGSGKRNDVFARCCFAAVMMRATSKNDFCLGKASVEGQMGETVWKWMDGYVKKKSARMDWRKELRIWRNGNWHERVKGWIREQIKSGFDEHEKEDEEAWIDEGFFFFIIIFIGRTDTPAAYTSSLWPERFPLFMVMFFEPAVWKQMLIMLAYE